VDVLSTIEAIAHRGVNSIVNETIKFKIGVCKMIDEKYVKICWKLIDLHYLELRPCSYSLDVQ